MAHASNSGDLRMQFEGHVGPVTCLLVGPGEDDRKMLFSGSVDTTVKCWDLFSCDVIASLEGHRGPVWALTQKSTSLFSCSEDRTIKRWCQRRLVQLQSFTGHSRAVTLILGLEDPSGVILCTGSLDATVRLWHEDGTSRFTLSHHEDGISCMIEAAEDSLLVGSRDGKITHWNLQTGTLRSCLQHDDWVMCLLEALGSWWSGSRDSSIKRWNPADGCLLATLRGHHLGVNTLLYFSGSILSGSADRTVKQWHPGDEAVVASIEGLSGVSSLLELPRGIFRTVNRGEATLLPKPRATHSEVVSNTEGPSSPPRTSIFFSDDKIVQADCDREDHGDSQDCLISIDSVPWERLSQGDIPPPHLQPPPARRPFRGTLLGLRRKFQLKPWRKEL